MSRVRPRCQTFRETLTFTRRPEVLGASLAALARTSDPNSLCFGRRLTLDAIARVTRMAGQSLKQGR
jgi:hypothetical protein